jgi:hypothetical protein
MSADLPRERRLPVWSVDEIDEIQFAGAKLSRASAYRDVHSVRRNGACRCNSGAIRSLDHGNRAATAGEPVSICWAGAKRSIYHGREV